MISSTDRDSHAESLTYLALNLDRARDALAEAMGFDFDRLNVYTSDLDDLAVGEQPQVYLTLTECPILVRDDETPTAALARFFGELARELGKAGA